MQGWRVCTSIHGPLFTHTQRKTSTKMLYKEYFSQNIITTNSSLHTHTHTHTHTQRTQYEPANKSKQGKKKKKVKSKAKQCKRHKVWSSEKRDQRERKHTPMHVHIHNTKYTSFSPPIQAIIKRVHDVHTHTPRVHTCVCVNMYVLCCVLT